MKQIVLTFFLSLLFFGTNAQTGTIEGTVTQSDSSTSLFGINVYLEKTQLGATSNGSGFFRIQNVPAGNYVLVTSGIGYTLTKRDITVKANETLKLDLFLEETISTLNEVVAMTKGNVGIREIPGSVQYISPKEIEKFSYTDINRTLRAVPGVNLVEEDGFGLRPNIGLRGTGVERSSKITIMEDGVLMSPAPYVDPSAYYFPTIGRIQAVEILKGSSQIKYGPFTTGGAINFLSTQLPSKFAGKLTLLGGSFGGRNLHAFVGNAHKNVAYMVETFQYSSDGFKKLDGGGNTGFNKEDYLAKVRINTKEGAKIYQSLTFKLGQATETSNETYLGLSESDFEADPFRRYAASQKDVMKTTQSQFSLTHFAKISKHIHITTTAYRSDFERNWYKLDKLKDSTGASVGIGDLLENPTAYKDAFEVLKGATGTNASSLYVRANNRVYYAQGVQTALGINFKTNAFTHEIDFGARIHQDQVDRFQWDDQYAMNNGVMQLTNSGTPGTESNRIGTANAFASYVQYKLKYKKFTFVPGLRYENIRIEQKDYGKNDIQRLGTNLVKNSNQVDVFIPGAGLDYQFNKYMSTFAGVHKGFSPPGPQDETNPEESINYELGFRYTKNSLSGQATLFFNDYSNLLGSDLSAVGGNGSGDLFNGGEVEAKGLEFQLSYDLLATRKKSAFALPITVTYTYTDAKFKNSFSSTFGDWGTVSAGDEFPYLAKNQFTVMLGLEHHKFSLNLSGRYMDEMRTSPGQGAIPANGKTDAYFIIDVSANYNVHRNISLFASCTNITNKVYVVARRPSGLRPGMPQAFNIGLKANF